MARSAGKRQRVSSPIDSHGTDEKSSPSTGDAMLPEADWQGWAEIESEPAFFNVMLREMGVRGVTVREIFSLDSEMLTYLPRPVHAIIFLFRWKEDEEFIDARYRSGSKLWFANQTVSNACASYALVNIINNIPDLHLGPQLEHFRDFTEDLTPALRGDALANFEFIKTIHNSFARSMDKLNGDLHMKNQVDSQRQEKRRRHSENSTEDAAHHFVAFMPIDGVLWKMDGLEWQPRSLGKVLNDDWLDHVKSTIESRMSRYSTDDIDFAILGLVQDPLVVKVEQLASNVNALQQLQVHASSITGDDTPLFHSDPHVLLGPDSSYGLDSSAISNASNMSALDEILRTSSVSALQATAQELIRDQMTLRRAVKDEQGLQLEDHSRASKRRHDYGDAISRWFKVLVRREAIRGLMLDDGS